MGGYILWVGLPCAPGVVAKSVWDAGAWVLFLVAICLEALESTRVGQKDITVNSFSSQVGNDLFNVEWFV